MVVLEFIFWLSLFLIFWTYFGYFLALKLISLIYTRPIKRSEEISPVSLIITAYNEERRIREKLQNALELDYPKELLEIIVVSDASSDRTEEIVSEFADQGVKLLVMSERHGKHYGQGRGIRSAANEIVVLSDATTFLAPDALRNLVGNFADPSIGCVSGQDRILSAEGELRGEGAYVRYEMLLRELESRVGSLVGVSGSFFATRKSLCHHWIDNMSSDFYMPLVAIMNGQRSVSEPTAVGTYTVLQDPAKEFTRKVRTVVHGLEVLSQFMPLLNPFKYPVFAIQLFSHKLCRWLVPFCMIVALPTNYFLLGSSFIYSLLIAAQLIFYILITASLLFEGLKKNPAIKLVSFFAMVNLSILVAWYKYWTNQNYVVWDATKR